MKYYTIKSTSEEGIYYLVNGWNKNKTFWTTPEQVTPAMLFGSLSRAKSSLTKLLKIMPDYSKDKFEEITINI